MSSDTTLAKMTPANTNFAMSNMKSPAFSFISISIVHIDGQTYAFSLRKTNLHHYGLTAMV